MSDPASAAAPLTATLVRLSAFSCEASCTKSPLSSPSASTTAPSPFDAP
eukprot:CAMPEP_0198684396 /NCGR_PEP_ID=MMETSP1468-20131203/12172_1 /TAXON_ID=1461545 /ORGANISM="Mantoniella sp, Strain CCMP1436" /LENGTH=48 /DNA_ID= /DNA_START= /DNA_END= /DNA_ORIENTATION=